MPPRKPYIALVAALGILGTHRPAPATAETFYRQTGANPSGALAPDAATANPAVPAVAAAPAPQPLRSGALSTIPGPTPSGFPGPVTWSLASGAPPTGMTPDAATGAVTGTPTATGNFVYALRGTSGAVSAVTDPISVTIRPRLAVVPMASTDVTFRKGQSAYLALPVDGRNGTTGGVGAISWTYGGTVPTNMSFRQNVGSGFNYAYLVGTPSAVQSLKGQTFTATDPIDNASATSDPFNVTVVDLVGPGDQTINNASSFTIPGPTPYGFPGTVSWALASGAYPPGMTLGATTGALSGQPSNTSTATYTFTLRATSGPVTAVTDPISVTSTAPPPPGLTWHVWNYPSQKKTTVPYCTANITAGMACQQNNTYCYYPSSNIDYYCF